MKMWQKCWHNRVFSVVRDLWMENVARRRQVEKIKKIKKSLQSLYMESSVPSAPSSVDPIVRYLTTSCVLCQLCSRRLTPQKHTEIHKKREKNRKKENVWRISRLATHSTRSRFLASHYVPHGWCDTLNTRHSASSLPVMDISSGCALFARSGCCRERRSSACA